MKYLKLIWKWIIKTVGPLLLKAAVFFILLLAINQVFIRLKSGMFSEIIFRKEFGEINETSTAIDYIGNLISGYSLFFTVIIFLVGIPLTLSSYRSSKKIDEFRKTYDEKLESVKAEIAENNAYNIINEAYNEDPKRLNQGEGKKALKEFSKCFEEKQEREAKRYFYEGLKYKQDKDTKNINHVYKNKDLNKEDELEQLKISIEYFSMCEKMLPYESKDASFKASLYREKASALKCLGLYYYYHNSILAMDYFWGALEYFQKAVQSDENDVLPFNRKSNTLKDIYRLIKETENREIRLFLLEKIKETLMVTSVCIFDLKEIAKFIDNIPQEYRVCFKKEELNNLKSNIGHCKKQRCFESQRIVANVNYIYESLMMIFCLT